MVMKLNQLAGYPWCEKDIQATVIAKEVLVNKSGSIVVTLVGAAAFLFAGYVLLTSLPDLRRYIRISTM
jgi:hypothetical protein